MEDNTKAVDKCPRCGCTETDSDSYRIDYFIVESTVYCKHCGNIKYKYEYGNVLVEDWKDMTEPPEDKK